MESGNVHQKSLQREILVVLFMAILPLLGVFVYDTYEMVYDVRNNLRRDSVHYAVLAGLSHQAAAERIWEFSSFLAQSDQFRNGSLKSCEEYLSWLHSYFSAFSAISKVSLDGDVGCSSPIISTPVNVSDRATFQKARSSGGFGASDFVIGRISHHPSISYMFPVRGEQSEPIAVVSVGLRADAKSNLVSESVFTKLPIGSSESEIDAKGILIKRLPAGDLMGQLFPIESVRLAIKGNRKGSVTDTDIDGVQKVFGYNPITVPGHSDSAYMVVALPDFTKIWRSYVRVDLALLLIGALIGIYLAWTLVRIWFLSRIRYLGQVASSIADGEYGARVALSAGVSGSQESDRMDAFDKVGFAINELAAGLEKSEAALFEAIEEREDRQEKRLSSSGALAEHERIAQVAPAMHQPVSLLEAQRAELQVRLTQYLIDPATHQNDLRATLRMMSKNIEDISRKVTSLHGSKGPVLQRRRSV